MEQEHEISQEEEKVEYPSLMDRVQSIFIDNLLIIALMIIFSLTLDQFDNPPDWVRIALFVSIFVVYEPLCVAFGCTLGNYIKGIRVRQVDNAEKKINIIQAFVRFIVKVALGWLSFLTVHSNTQKRAIHDMAAMSVMVKA